MPAAEVTWAQVVPGDVVLDAGGELQWEVAERVEETKIRLSSLRGDTEYLLDTTKAKSPRVTRVATASERRELAEALIATRLHGKVQGRQPGKGEPFRVPVFSEASDVGALYAHIYLFHTVIDAKVPAEYPKGMLEDLLREHSALHAKKASSIPEPHVHDPAFVP